MSDDARPPSDGPDRCDGPDGRDRRDDGRPEQARPRDRTGRPLPYGTTGVALTEPADPATVAEAVALGLTRWDEQRYFEAHELLEHAWKAASGVERDLWKGVIQVAVAGVHLQRDNRLGAHRLLGRALDRLGTAPDEHDGVDVARLRTTATAARDRLAAGDAPAADWGPFPTVPGAPTPTGPRPDTSGHGGGP